MAMPMLFNILIVPELNKLTLWSNVIKLTSELILILNLRNS